MPLAIPPCHWQVLPRHGNLPCLSTDGDPMTQKQDRSRDRLLGMNQPITRRDFLNGIAIGAAAAASGPLLAASPVSAEAAPGAAPLPTAAQDALGYYPPLLT